MDCSCGKSESSVLTLKYFQTQSNVHLRMKPHQGVLTEVEEDLLTQLIGLFKLDNEKDDAVVKQFLPTSMD